MLTRQTMQEKSSAEKKGDVEKAPPTPVEKQPSTGAQAATRQPAYAAAMNGHVPPGLTAASGYHHARSTLTPATHPEAIHEAATDVTDDQVTTEAIPPVVTTAPPQPAATGPAGPHAKPKVVNPKSDPRFQHVITKLNKSAAKAKKHPPATKKVAEAHAAARPPENERMAKAKAKQVAVMQGAQAKKPEPKSFLDLVLAAIKAIMPKNVEGTKAFMKGEQKEQLKGTMQGNLNTQKAEATGDLKAATAQQPDANQVPPEQATALPHETSVHPPEVGAADAIPEAKAESEVSLQQSKQTADAKLKDAQVTPDQLKEANDPRFTAVVNSKSAVEKHADTAPQHYRADEQKLLTQEAAKATGDEKQGLAALQMVHGKSGLAVKGNQVTAQARDEARRKEVSVHIEEIYARTKKTVDDKLNSLEAEVSKTFDQGVANAMQHMTDSVNKNLDERYGGILGFFTKLDETLGLLPDEATTIYTNGSDLFMREMDGLIRSIATVVETRLKEAKDEIAKGQQEIHTYVEGLPKDLQAIGKVAEQEIAGRFDELRHGVDEKKNELVQKLAQRYKDASEKADEKLKQIQEEHKGLLDTFFDKLAEVVKILGEFKDRITNMLKTGRDTILLIVAHPIDFLKHLIDAIKLGIRQFVDNIWTHLKAGFMAWLFGTLEDAGIQIPKDFSLGSILKLVLQILGITYENMRAKFVKLIGERNVAIIEKVGQVIYTLITSGPEALWEQIKEFLGNLKEMVLDAIQNWIVTTVIKAAVIKLLSLFNPAGAIIQAIMAIYNTVMFFIERMNQILTFVESIINSVHKIAVGDIGDAANWIEKALARTIPIIIGFLARLLGLGNISEEIQKIIKKIQDFVDKAIDKLIDKVVKGIGKLFGKKEEKLDDKEMTDEKLHEHIIQDASKKLNKVDTQHEDPKLAYDEKVKLGQELQEQGQQNIDKHSKGIKFTIDIGKFDNAESAKAIPIKLRIAPNTLEKEISVILEDPKYAKYVDIAIHLQKVAEALRLKYDMKPKEGNVAAAKVVLKSGEEFPEKATSKKEPLDVPTGEQQIFPPSLTYQERRRAPIDMKSELLNKEHAEYKIFNALADALKKYCQEHKINPADIEGDLYMYTSLRMCIGCHTTAFADELIINDRPTSFTSLFPKIKLAVFWKDSM